MNFILAAAKVVGDLLPQPESKFSFPLDWGTNGRGFLHRSNEWVTRASACEVFDCLVPGMHGRSGGPSGVSMISGVIIVGVVVKAEGTNGRGFLHRSNEWVTRASACEVFDCLVPGMHGRSGGPSGVSMISGVIVAGIMVKAESNNKNQFFFDISTVPLCVGRFV